MPINYITSLGVEVLTTDPGDCNLRPSAYFTATTIGNNVSFNASGSSDPDGSIVSYHWDFGDGSSTTTTGSSTSHSYSNGNYLVILTVTDDEGKTDTHTGLVTPGSGGGFLRNGVEKFCQV